MTSVSRGPRRFLSGVQPSGKLHLGNYFGAIRQHIDSQGAGVCFYFIADYHAMTTIQDPKALRENVRDVALDYLALGLDPEKAIFFRQSDVPEVTELAWILSTVTNMGLLERYGHRIDRASSVFMCEYVHKPFRARQVLSVLRIVVRESFCQFAVARHVGISLPATVDSVGGLTT